MSSCVLVCGVISNQSTSKKPRGVENMGGIFKFDGESLSKYMGGACMGA